MSTPTGESVQGQSGRPEYPSQIGPFKIVGILGRGGMGVVFDAISPAGERVALKVIRPQGDPEHAELLVARFTREAKILAQLDHPGIVRLVACGDVDGVLYLAMKRIEGVSLLTIRRRGSLGFDAVVQLGIQLSSALAHMHEAGVVHRDIKPANILIDTSGRPVITDFGISGMTDATGITRMGDLLGSPGFMAPEVTDGKPPSELSDQFSLGRLLYELGASGPAKRLPKNAPILEILAASLEIDWNRFPKTERWPELELILRRMLATNPAGRFPNATACRAALLTLANSDLLDFDTLGEHIGNLGLMPRLSWDAHSRPPDEVFVLDPSALERESIPDEPEAPKDPPRAGERPESFFTEKTDLDLPIDAQESPSMPTPLVEERTDPESVELLAAALVPKVDDPTEPPPSHPSAPAATNTPTDRLAPVPPSEPERDAVPPPDQGMRLFDIGKKRDPVSAGSDDLARVPGETTEAQIARLEWQISRLREQLTHARREVPKTRGRSSLVRALMFGLVAAVVAFAIGRKVRDPLVRAQAPSEIVLLPVAKAGASAPLATYEGPMPPPAKDRTDARGLLDAAVEHLAKREFDLADSLLRQCIQLANLPECHRTLGSLLALTQNPAARTHLGIYVDLAPGAADAETIRQQLLKSP